MIRLINFFKRHWFFATKRTYYTQENLTKEEFKKLWNDSLEEMKIK